MRARLGFACAKKSYIIREVNLKEKPQSLLDISPKGTVPVLKIDNLVIEESLEILLWLKLDSQSNNFLKKMQLFQDDFIFNLNRFKYYDKYKPNQSIIYFQKKLEKYFNSINYNFTQLDSIAVYPLIRQARIANAAWFNNFDNSQLHQWMAIWDQKLIDYNIMQKFDINIDTIILN